MYICYKDPSRARITEAYVHQKTITCAYNIQIMIERNGFPILHIICIMIRSRSTNIHFPICATPNSSIGLEWLNRSGNDNKRIICRSNNMCRFQ